MNWGINDSRQPSTALWPDHWLAGVKLDLTLTSATTYSLTLTPLNGRALTRKLEHSRAPPINYVNFRLYNTASSGPNDVADNYGISTWKLSLSRPRLALVGLGFAGLLFLRRRK